MMEDIRRFFGPRTLIPLAVLSFGQLLYFFGFHLLFVLGLVYFIATVIPYPSFCRSMVSRLVIAFVLVVSLLQVSAAIQFFVAPNSKFTVVSIITYIACAALAVALRRRRQEDIVWLDKKDAQAIVGILFFLIPLVWLFFGSLNPDRILTFTGTQSPDAISHYGGIISMATTQHLDYRSNTYYPRGFHIASAFLLDGVRANQKNLSWISGQRMYVGMYMAWGAVLGYLLFYLALQTFEALRGDKEKKYSEWLLVLILGPMLSMLYLTPFVYYGFLNYYYVAAAVIVGLLFMFEYDRERLLDTPLVAFLLCTFGVSMSWGPLLAPALLLIPIFYIVNHKISGEITGLLRRKALWVVAAGYGIELIPIYLHLKYARLTSSQGINALGIITDYHFTISIIGLGLLLYFIVRPRIDRIGHLINNTLLSFYLLLSLLIGLQYFTVDQLRYYVIKTSFMVEMITLAFLSALFLYVCARRVQLGIREWVALPLIFTMGIFISMGITTNPVLPMRQVFRSVSRYAEPKFYATDVHSYAQLEMNHKLQAANSEILHYDQPDHKIFGDGLVTEAANETLYSTDGTPASAKCTGEIFSTLVYGVGAASEQTKLINSLKTCITIAHQKKETFYVVSDAQSIPYLERILGQNNVAYVD